METFRNMKLAQASPTHPTPTPHSPSASFNMLTTLLLSGFMVMTFWMNSWRFLIANIPFLMEVESSEGLLFWDLLGYWGRGGDGTLGRKVYKNQTDNGPIFEQCQSLPPSTKMGCPLRSHRVSDAQNWQSELDRLQMAFQPNGYRLRVTLLHGKILAWWDARKPLSGLSTQYRRRWAP